MTEQEATALAKKHISTERTPRQTQMREHDSRKLWQVSFAGDGEPPVVVTIDADKGEVLQVFEPMKIAPTKGIMDIITTAPEKFLE